ncbi:MAG: LacI family DNA-binding transcriptional regulator [Fimbriimonas sp.]|nr:LacI family DNA-binding transcriptional regulator [Fimbriimonas sp.]
MIKLSDIAERAGVSESTASRALANSPRISAETRELVQRLAQEAGYKVNQVARNLRTRSTMTIGLVVPEVSNPYFPRLVQLIGDRARAAGFALQLHLSGVRQEAEADCLASLYEHRVDGILLVTSESGLVARTQVEAMVASGESVVLLGWVEDADRFDLVYANDAGGGYQVAKHLVDLGHRRIATLGSARHRGPFDRVEGFLRGLREAGIADERHIPGRTLDEIEHAISRLCEETNPPTALFAYQDSIAALACRFLRQRCVVIPEQISVAGFDNLDLGTYLCPQLTSVDFPMKEMANRAVELLIERIKSVALNEPWRHIVVEPELVIRESCTTPRSADSFQLPPCPASSTKLSDGATE